MMTEGEEVAVGQDKLDKVCISVPSLDSNAHGKCQNTMSPF